MTRTQLSSTDTLRILLGKSKCCTSEFFLQVAHRSHNGVNRAFLTENASTRYKVCWQSPLFYNITLDERWFFTRVMGILRSYFMIGFLIGGAINTMSIYSTSLRLLVQSRFFHPSYQMDDLTFTLSAMNTTGARIRIRTIDIPTLSGPTSGVNLVEEFREWVTQGTRWTIGAAETFHYFVVKLLKGNFFFSGLSYFWCFVYYYGFVLCVSGLIQITSFLIQFVSIAHSDISISTCKPMQSWFNLPDDFAYNWIFPGFLIFFYVVVVGTAFCLDALVSQILALKERVSFVRQVCHFVSTQLVLWLYCLLEYKAIIEIAVYGKEACGHKPSDKSNLVATKPPTDEEHGRVEDGTSSTHVM